MPLDLHLGDRVGEFILDSYVGSGGFGVVWRAHRESDDQVVALKILTGAVTASDVSPLRAEVEVLAGAAASRSEHVVKVLGGGTAPAPFIAMEFIEGQDLQSLLNEEKHLSIERTIDVGLAISDALRALYETGIIHRDIKPANVMIDRDGVIKLADFGIARIVGYSTVTIAGQTAMTMAYAAPEVWDPGHDFGEPSHRSDLYALGVVLYQCLTGSPPFIGDFAMLFQAHTRRRPNLDALPGDIPPSLRIMLHRCLAKSQDDRPRDASECAGLLRRASAERRISSGNLQNEPRRFGAWVKDAPHETVPWAWHCHEEGSGRKATVEVLFSDDLNFGGSFNRALQSVSELTSFGAEKLLGSSRLLLFPSEAWHEAPPGNFQFWVAREDLAPPSAPLLTLAILRTAISMLENLLVAAEKRGLDLDLGHENLTVCGDGSIYLRRPGIERSDSEPRIRALSLLRGMALDDQAREALSSTTNLVDLWKAFVDNSSTVLATTKDPKDAPTVLASRRLLSEQRASEAVISNPSAIASPSRGVLPRQASTPTGPSLAKAGSTRSAISRRPLLLATAAMAIVALVGLIAVVALSGGGGSPSVAKIRTEMADYQVAGALPGLNRLIDKNPRNVDFLLLRSQANFLLGKMDAAAADADQALRLNPNSAEANDARGQVYDWQEDAVQALALTSKAIELDPKSAVYYAHRSALYFGGDAAKEKDDADQAAKLDANDPNTLTAQAFLYRTNNRYADAESELNKAIAADPKNGMHYTDRARLYYAMNAPDKALTAISNDLKEIDANPLWSAEGHWVDGTAYIQQSKNEEALREFGKAIELAPSVPAYVSWRGYCYYLMRNYSAATEDLNNAVGRSPNFADAYRVRALVRRDQNQLQEAQVDANTAVSLAPQNADYHEVLADIYYDMNNYNGAIGEATSSINIDGNQSDAYNVRALAKDAQGAYGGALTDINRAIEIDSNFALFRANRGLIEIHLKNFQAALTDLNIAITKEGTNAQYYNWRGIANYGLLNYSAAIADYSRAIQIEGNNSQYYLNRGFAEEDSSRIADARTDYQKAKSLATTSAQSKAAQDALDALGR